MTTIEPSISVILLAGGIGTRMQASMPKQFIQLENIPIVCHSFKVFLSMPEVKEIIVVCNSDYHALFSSENVPIIFAPPGHRRQDSVYNGFQRANNRTDLICIHDSARPFISPELIRPVFHAAHVQGAAALGMPIKYTVKECDADGFVQKTHSRDKIWEIQTPQVIRHDLLHRGFTKALISNITVTDDVSLVELLSHPIQIIKGCYENIKITTPEDLLLAKNLMRKRNGKPPL